MKIEIDFFLLLLSQHYNTVYLHYKNSINLLTKLVHILLLHHK